MSQFEHQSIKKKSPLKCPLNPEIKLLTIEVRKVQGCAPKTVWLCMYVVSQQRTVMEEKKLFMSV